MQEYTNATALIFAVECYKASEDCDFSEFFEAHFAELNSAINHPKDVNERTELILLFQSHSQSAHAIKSIFSACLTVNNQAEANLLAKIFLCHDHLGDSIRNKLLKIFSEYPDFWPNLSKGAMFINDLEGHEPNELISFEGLLDYLESSQGSETIRRWYQLMLEINFNFPIFRHFKAAYEAECLESFMNAYENLPDQDKEDQLAVGRLYRQMTED